MPFNTRKLGAVGATVWVVAGSIFIRESGVWFSFVVAVLVGLGECDRSVDACDGKRIMNTGIVGVWSAEALFKMGGQSDEILVFNHDGTGWLECINYYEWSADFFEWEPSSPGWIFLTWTTRIEPHKYTRKIIESRSVFTIEHTASEIREERAPSGLEMKILHIQIFDAEHEVYGLVSNDTKTRTFPTGQTI